MKREGYLFYFIVDSEDKNITLNDNAIQETMDKISSDTFISLYTTIAGSNTRDSLFMKKEFIDGHDVSCQKYIYTYIYFFLFSCYTN